MDYDKIVCNCCQVTNGMIKDAVDGGAKTLEEIQDITGAGTVCGGDEEGRGRSSVCPSGGVLPFRQNGQPNPGAGHDGRSGAESGHACFHAGLYFREGGYGAAYVC